MMKKEQILLILIILLAVFTRFYRLWEPPVYMFDEVYHAFTAVELEKGNKMAWEWWNTPPKGFAYEWTHPPLAKEAMVVGIKLLGNILPKQDPGVDGRVDPHPFSWRFPVALFGVGVVVMVYLLGKELFNEKVGLIASFLMTFEGLNFVQARIGMNDTFFLFFMLLAFWLFLRWESEKLGGFGGLGSLGIGIALGLALASKWTAIYAMAILGILGGLGILGRLGTCLPAGRELGIKKALLSVFYLLLATLIIPIIIYLISYIPFFTSGHTWQQFDELQHQMWWYHTSLKATHSYTSPWYSWPFLFRPVWYYVRYGSASSPQAAEIANTYAMGNPVIWWAGIVAIGLVVWELLRSFVVILKPKAEESRGLSALRAFARDPSLTLRMTPFLIVLLGYFGFFLPWALSPRIMFLYHYLPSVPFMILALGYGLGKIGEIGVIGVIGGLKINGKLLTTFYLLLSTLVFVYFYPHLSAFSVPTWLNDSYYWFISWK